MADGNNPVQVNGLGELHDQGGMTWTERERGWMAVPDEVLNTGSVASAIWVAHATQRRALVFIEIDGERIEVDHGDTRRSDEAFYRDEGGEG